MTIPFSPGSVNYTMGGGYNPENVEVPTFQNRAPTVSDINWPLGKRWIYPGVGEFTLENLVNVSGITTASWGLGASVPLVVAAAASPQVANARLSSVTFSGVSIAAGATQTFVITNSTVSSASSVITTDYYGVTAGSAISIVSITPSAGSISIVVTNGAGATTDTANLTFVTTVLS
jgi:hypothetical protein